MAHTMEVNSGAPYQFASQRRRQQTHAGFRSCGRRCTSMSAYLDQEKDPSAIIEDVLRLVGGTDRGAAMSEEQQAQVDALLEKLESIGVTQEPRPLDNPHIYGNFSVAYVSTRNAQQKGQPAGGRFRQGVGKALFRTRRVCQSVLEPNIVTNKVEFSLLGILPGHVGLRGCLDAVGDSRDTVKVDFDRPELVLPGLGLRVGPKSSVVLTTSYLDEHVRLGRGSRGSRFVFVKGGEADAAGMNQVGLSTTSWWGASLVAAAAVVVARSVARFLPLGLERLRLPLAALFFLILLLTKGPKGGFFKPYPQHATI